MTEQQACTLCGAGGHTAAQRNMEMDLIRHIAGLYSGKAIKGDFTQVYITGNEIWMAQQILASQQGEQATSAEIARVHPEQAEGGQGERERFIAFAEVEYRNDDEFSKRDFDIAHRAWNGRAALAQPSPKCATCDDNGRIGGPSFYAPDEGGEPCPDCAQTSPAPELERPEVVAWLVVAKYPHKETRRAIFLYEANADDQGAEWCCDDGVVTISPLIDRAFVAQHDRIVGALRYKAELYDEVWELVTGKGYANVTTAISELEKEVAMLRSYESEWEQLLKDHEEQRSAAQARVAELEAHCARLGQGGAERYWENRWRDEVAQAGQVPEGKIIVSEEPLRRLLHALSGEPHLIRELQATRHPAALFKDNPINVLVAEYNAAPAQGGE